jgi:hypothetical protein
LLFALCPFIKRCGLPTGPCPEASGERDEPDTCRQKRFRDETRDIRLILGDGGGCVRLAVRFRRGWFGLTMIDELVPAISGVGVLIMTCRELFDAVEYLVDGESLSSVLEQLSAVCAEKAEAIRSNWQDAVLAKQWDAASRLLDEVIERVTV